MNEVKREYSLHMLRIVRLSLLIALFVSPQSIRPAQADAPKTLASPTDPADQSTSVLPEKAADTGGTGDIEVAVGDVPLYLWGIPMHCLSDAINANPRASRFHLHWVTSDAGSTGIRTIWYDRTRHTLRYWSYDSYWEAGMPVSCTAVYRKVTDGIIHTIVAADLDERSGTPSNLTDYGCTCRGSGVSDNYVTLNTPGSNVYVSPQAPGSHSDKQEPPLSTKRVHYRKASSHTRHRTARCLVMDIGLWGARSALLIS